MLMLTIDPFQSLSGAITSGKTFQNYRENKSISSIIAFVTIV
ncbi:hypothetical protein [Leuconostoc gelidum]|nr:hypothetical protein [Leuconostoc gelidum]